MLSTGTRVGQGQIKPISDLAISGNDTDEMKASAIIVVSNELAQLGGAVAARLFSDVLRKACALAIDQQFLDTVLTGISPTASSGNTSIAILEDVAALYASVDSDASSKLFFVTDSAGAKFLSAKVTSTGEIAFPTMAPSGGTLAGTPVVVADAAQGKLVLLDAGAIAVAVSDLRLDSTATASLQLDTEPDSPPTASTTLRSLFQTNETALRCERWFSVEVLRATAAAYVDVSWSGNSPTL
jgi:HK97 family phage major capsid protein